VDLELRRLIVRHRHVAPMVSALLAGTDARVRIEDAAGNVVLQRDAGAGAGETQRYPIAAGGAVVGWVEGPKVGAAVAAVLSYAWARETDKRSLSQEALDRYRELNLIYDLAQSIGATLEVPAVCRVAIAEASRLPGGNGFLLLRDVASGALRPAPASGDPPVHGGAAAGEGIVGAVADGEAEIVNEVAADGRAAPAERAFASLAAAPLVVRGQRIGVVGVASTAAIMYRAGDLKVLAAIAALTGPAIDQATAHEAAVGRLASASPAGSAAGAAGR
jgi:adenylate cyclase